MKTFIGLLIISACINGNAQAIVGAWEAKYTNDEGKMIRNVVIFSENGYQVATEYDAQRNFVSTNGGTWSLKGDMLTEGVEFDTRDSLRVGSEGVFKIKLSKTTLQAEGSPTWNRIDAGKPGALAGAWLMSGRKRNGEGEIQERGTSGPRKTMKLLSGTRFQWIAYNTETKQFLGTGGGTYTTLDGKYTENIEFFSRDASRVGASLEFNYQLMDGKWHHSGANSRGEPLYEVWEIRK
jgi:hypothetical protein